MKSDADLGTRANAGRWQTVLAVDYDAAACATYRANFPGVRVEQCDLQQRMDLLTAGMADVLLGGPPCPPFSKSGKRLGKKDQRNCIPQFIDAVRIVKPRMFLMEQVDGILQGDSLPYFGTVLTGLERLGYAVQYRELDAVSFGVPQFRNRVWTWGIRADLYRDGMRHAWPRPTHCWPPPESCMFGAALLPGITVRQALGLWNMGRAACDTKQNRTLRSIDEPATCCAGDDRRILIQSHADPAQTIDRPATALRSGGDGHDGCCLRLQYDHGVAELDAPSPTIKAGGNIDAGGKQGGGCPPVIRVFGAGTNPHFKGDVRTERDITDEPSPTIPCGDHFGNVLPKIQEYRWSDAMFEKHPPFNPDAPAPAIQAKFFKGGAEGLLAIDGPRIVRRLTPLECLRLQSGPDDFKWPDKISKTNQYRVVGNGWASRMGAVFSEAFYRTDPDAVAVVSLFCGGGLGEVGWHGRYWSYQPEAARGIA